MLPQLSHTVYEPMSMSRLRMCVFSSGSSSVVSVIVVWLVSRLFLSARDAYLKRELRCFLVTFIFVCSLLSNADRVLSVLHAMAALLLNEWVWELLQLFLVRHKCDWSWFRCLASCKLLCELQRVVCVCVFAHCSSVVWRVLCCTVHKLLFVYLFVHAFVC